MVVRPTNRRSESTHRTTAFWPSLRQAIGACGKLGLESPATARNRLDVVKNRPPGHVSAAEARLAPLRCSQASPRRKNRRLPTRLGHFAAPGWARRVPIDRPRHTKGRECRDCIDQSGKESDPNLHFFRLCRYPRRDFPRRKSSRAGAAIPAGRLARTQPARFRRCASQSCTGVPRR